MPAQGEPPPAVISHEVKSPSPSFRTLIIFVRLMNFRKSVERLSRGLVFKRRLPPEFHRFPIYVSPEAGLRYWLRMSKVDLLLYRMALELVKPGACVWDVGANVGLFSVCASSLAGQSGCVVAIEPDVWLAHLLTRSACELKLRGLNAAPITVLCSAVSDGNRISHLQISERSRAANHLADSTGSSQAQGNRFSQAAVSTSLDFLLDYFPAPSVLKIDVETHEARVLRGSRKLLETIRPTIWCEVSPENATAAFDLLHPLDYELYAAAAKVRVPLKRASWDTLAIPAARTGELR
jgi:FkbM family methyltransferase